MYYPGNIIGPYTLVREIGKGSFAVVWLAERRGALATTQFALKIPKEDYLDIEAIKQEAAVWLAASGHSNVVRIIEAEIYDEQHIVVVSEYAPDGSLKDWLNRHGGKAPTIEAAIEMMLGILSGLKHLHARQIVHRDLKPDNVLLQSETPRLVDFGLARVVKAHAQSDFIRGTPSYLSPEAIRGESSAQMDVWAAGVIFYQLVSGYLPFRRDNVDALMWAIVHEVPAPLPTSLPTALQDIILRSLEKSLALRYSSADEMILAIRQASLSISAELSRHPIDQPGIFITDEPTLPRANARIEIPIHPSKAPTSSEGVLQTDSKKKTNEQMDSRHDPAEKEKPSSEFKPIANLLQRFQTWSKARAEQRQEFVKQHEIELAEARRRDDELRKQREHEEKARRDDLRRQQEEERRRRAEEAKRLKEQEPVIVKSLHTVSSEPPVSGAILDSKPNDLNKDSAEAIKAAASLMSPHRQRAAEILRQRTVRQERARLPRGIEDEIEMDPEVAEMVATASAARTAPPEKADKRELTAKRKIVVEISTGSAYKLPPVDMLEPAVSRPEEAEEELKKRATILAGKLHELGAGGHIHKINPGPVVTTFEFKPDPGIKYSRVVGLADDLCLALQAESIRIDRIRGKSTIGIEVPNQSREKICLREIIESAKFQSSPSKLSIALGKTGNGESCIADLTKMPHLLIAGALDTSKSVLLDAIICSILYKASPEEVKFIMVDPKRVELGLYEGIPHLLTPIVTDPKRAANALKWAVNEMENRYRQLAELGVRNSDQYNQQILETTMPTIAEDNPEARKPLPYIVVAIDELADLMMVARGDVETSIARLAQMGHSVGLYLILVTQRPSSDVLTGTIKANIPSRIALRMVSKADSRTIIDSNGAEELRQEDEMLFLPSHSSEIVRLHRSSIKEIEVKQIADYTRQQAEPDYNEAVTLSKQESFDGDEDVEQEDEMFHPALEIVTDMGRASTSVLQRRLSIGYGQAAKILDMMERRGFIGPAEGSKPRKVLQAAYDFRGRLDEILKAEWD